MRKGTVITEEQVHWSEISAEAWKAARDSAAARAQNGNPMSDEDIERRARNAQDRMDLRALLNGGNFGSGLSRSELVASANRQLQDGLYGNSKQAFRKVRQMREDDAKADRKMQSKYASTCSRCQNGISVGQTIYWNPEFRTVTCEQCH